MNQPVSCACGCGRIPNLKTSRYWPGHCNKGRTPTPEQRALQSERMKGRVPTEATREKLRAAWQRSPIVLTPEQEAARRAKIAASARGMKHPWAARPNSKNHRTTRGRARQFLAPTTCALAHIGHCQGPIDTAHLDQDPTNNAPENLAGLCHSHHALYDRGRIDIANPVMPEFYIDRRGKRRYRHRKAA